MSVSGLSDRIVHTFTSRGHRYLAGHAATRHRPGAPGKERAGATRCGQDSIRARSVREMGAVMSLETNENWPGFSPEESLQWARALLSHSPQALPPTYKALAHASISRGVPHEGPDWRRTAEQARTIDFTPVLYHSLFKSLQSIDPGAFNWHPKHREINKRACVPGIPFETQLWKDWPQLVLKDGFSPGTAAELVLTCADLTYRS